MRILFINTEDTRGGAAIAALRLKTEFSRRGHKVFQIVGIKHSKDENVFCTRTSKTEKIIEKIIDKAFNKFGMQYLFFPFSSSVILKEAQEFKPDVISLHNTHGGYFKTSLLKELSKIAPVVWTLHDMWSFTGNAAHTFGDMSWKHFKSQKSYKNCSPSIGLNTGKILLKYKKAIYKQSDITLITPSKWLKNLAIQSPVFKGKDIIHVYNGIDLTVFKPRDKEIARKALEIPLDARVIMFSSDSINIDNPWKGGRIFLDILTRINSMADETIHLLILGDGELSGFNDLNKFKVHKVGYVQNDTIMTLCFAASDVFVYPTKADNLPNVLVEAVACGTPCVTFDIGGCREIIEDKINGFLIDPFNVENFASSVIRLINDSQRLKALAENARKHAEQIFSVQDMQKRYMEVFNAVIKK